MTFEDFSKAVLVLAAVTTAFAVGYFIGTEAEKAKIPEYQNDGYEELT